jgi:LysM repeat protein
MVPSTTNPPPTQSTVPVATTGEVYTVVQGDTPFGIATKLGVEVSALLAANGLNENSLLVPGQRLAVPHGDSLPSAAARGAFPGTGRLSGARTTAKLRRIRTISSPIE